LHGPLFRNDGKQQSLPFFSTLLFTTLLILSFFLSLFSPFSSFHLYLPFLFPYLLISFSLTSFFYFFLHIVSPSIQFNAFSQPEWKNTLKILKERYRMEAAGNEGAETKRKFLLMKWCGTVSKSRKRVVKRERMCMLKIQPELGPVLFCCSLAFASLS